MLDDVLSAVDAHMADWLVKHLIQGPLLADKTRIVATHSELCMAAANQVVKLFRGKVSVCQFTGPYPADQNLLTISEGRFHNLRSSQSCTGVGGAGCCYTVPRQQCTAPFAFPAMA